MNSHAQRQNSAMLFKSKTKLSIHTASNNSSSLQEAIMIITTTQSVEGKRIVDYKGVIAGEAILGVNVFKDMFSGIRDFVGGRSGTYEKELEKARNYAFKELEQKAIEAGANAVVGVDIDYEVLGTGNGMLMVSASGTAVVVA
ncbi:Hypothetical protein VS_II0425 [Vibrio atlanticus]|uniref:UPF0145 protein VS_II0425 n=17 Tax=Vibrio TaxID=662 RepID=B7VR40_VIBA3|nr:Hypothetical protein VS_II0425 [Vibrio atlanticus]